ncbi:MAG TPA: DEAD/DEAH box helicase, partial [Candidatus Thermoplasmatota archaeon]|nr:DEAD/DEAH box helicase [Candidatus Thermoplasmatota archaeon]
GVSSMVPRREGHRNDRNQGRDGRDGRGGGGGGPRGGHAGGPGRGDRRDGGHGGDRGFGRDGRRGGDRDGQRGGGRGGFHREGGDRGGASRDGQRGGDRDGRGGFNRDGPRGGFGRGGDRGGRGPGRDGGRDGWGRDRDRDEPRVRRPDVDVRGAGPARQPKMKVAPEAQKVVDLKMTFADLKLSSKTIEALDRIGFQHPTPIQEKTIPLLLDGKDVIGQARTGSGKTAAFGLPIIETYDPEAKHVQALILAPTRELALQIQEEMLRFGANRDLRVLAIYGGTSYEPQEKALREGVHVVVGTPGRIMDHMERGNLDLSKCNLIVLDEADRMLDMGFIDDVEWILKRMPGKHHRQTLLFSATMAEEIKGLTRRFMVDPAFVRVSADELTVPQIDQEYYPVGRRNKHWALCRLLDNEPDMDLCLVFCATKSMVDRLVDDLNRWGYSAEGLHGDMPQSKRERVLEEFDEGKVRVLVATDVAARGLDIDHITHVVNWDLPEQEPEVYVHRIGRTGRAGRKGKAVSFATVEDKAILKRIEMLIGREIRQGEPPASPDGRPDRVERKVDWDELADKYGNVHVKVFGGSRHGLTPYLLHKVVQRSTRLPDHAIRDIRIGEEESSVAIPKDVALAARNGIERFEVKGHPLRAEFESRETTVRTA